jgi:hypothetical protein
MAYSSADLSSADLASAAADQPLAIGRNWLRHADSVAPQWKQGGSWAAGSDETDSDGPTSYAWDEFDDLQTYPDASQTTWYLLMDFGASEVGIIDSLVLLNCTNLESVRVRLQIADDNAFSSNLITISDNTLGASFSGRHVDLVIKESGDSNAKRYSSVRYARLLFTKGSGFIPRIGEVILGRRRQLKAHPTLPYAPRQLTGKRARFESAGGVVTDYVFHRGRRRLEGTITPHQTAYIDDWVALFEQDCDLGKYGFVWVDDPNSSATDAYWMRWDDMGLSGPFVGYTERQFRISAMEQGPNFRRVESLGA